jgi:hypothetical protein
MNNRAETGFKDLLNSMMSRRWYITAMVLGGFILIIGGIFGAIMWKTPMSTEWKELLLLLLGAFIGSYGKIIDYWFSDTDKDKMLVAKMDEENDTPEILLAKMDKGLMDIPEQQTHLDIDTPQVTPQVKVEIEEVGQPVQVNDQVEKKGVEIDEDGDGVMDGLDFDNDGVIDEYFPHRNCQHVWGDSDGDGDEECLICGLIKPIEE